METSNIRNCYFGHSSCNKLPINRPRSIASHHTKNTKNPPLNIPTSHPSTWALFSILHHCNSQHFNRFIFLLSIAQSKKDSKKTKKMTLSLRESIVSNGNNNNGNNIFVEGMEEGHGGRRRRRSRSNRVRSRGDGKESAREGGGEDGGCVSGREKLKRHRMEVAGKVWIPEAWGKEELLKDWVDSSSFDLSLVPLGVVSARKALVQDQCRPPRSITTLQIDNRW